MSNSKPSNTRRSQWEVFDRCLTLLLRLMREPATSDELLRIVIDKAEDGEHLSRSSVGKRFEEDRSRLRNWFECELKYDRSTNQYALVHSGRPLLDLPPEALRGLAFLQSAFNEDDAPMSQEVRVLVERVLMALPPKSQREVGQQRGLLELNLGQRDGDSITDDVWEAVQTACSEHRQLEFEYFSPGQSDGKARTHVVEPYRHFFDSVKGHYYLDCFWLESRGPRGSYPQNRMQPFRLGRMRNPRVLPTHFPNSGRNSPQEELIYELTPEVARRGVTQHFPGCIVVPQSDGSAVVHATSTNLFLDLRTLLHYGPNCHVTGGPKAVEMMKALVENTYKRYLDK